MATFTMSSFCASLEVMHGYRKKWYAIHTYSKWEVLVQIYNVRYLIITHACRLSPIATHALLEIIRRVQYLKNQKSFNLP